MDLSNLFSPRLQISTLYGSAKHFVIIGAGGTGGYLIPNLTRQIALQNEARGKEGHAPHSLTIIDGDIVEEKNLVRQNFVDRDLNKNKAEVMADRYGKAFQLSISYIPEYIVSTDMLVQLIDMERHVPVFIDCVDNNKTRVFIEEAHRTFNQSYFISSGNEEMTGQVVLSTNSGRKQLESVFESEEFGYPVVVKTPSILNMFPSMLDGSDKLPTEMSCAENAESAPQNIHTNMTAANLIFGFANKILAKPEDVTKGIDHFAVFYNLNNMTFRTFATTKEDFKSALKMVEGNPAYQEMMPATFSADDAVAAPVSAEVEKPSAKRKPGRPRTRRVSTEEVPF